MTADWARLPYEVVDRIGAASSPRSPASTAWRSTSPQAPGTIEWE